MVSEWYLSPSKIFSKILHYDILLLHKGDDMSDIQVFTSPDELTVMLKDENKIKEYANYVIFEEMKKSDAWIATFNPPLPLSRTLQTRMYRWLQKDEVKKWMTKLNKSLEVDWIDKRVNALQHLFNIGTNTESSEKSQIDGLDKFLTHLNKVENKITIDHGITQQVNIVQVVQDRLDMITRGATITPDGLQAPSNITNADLAIDAILIKK